jgi:hypothetical protein
MMIVYQQAVSNVSWLLTKYHIKTIHIPVKENIHMLRPIKDNVGLKVTSIYCIPSECGKVYVGQMGRSLETRCKNGQHTCLGQPEKSTVANCRFEMAQYYPW